MGQGFEKQLFPKVTSQEFVYLLYRCTGVVQKLCRVENRITHKLSREVSIFSWPSKCSLLKQLTCCT